MRENGWALSAILDSSGGHFHTAFRAAPCRVCRYARTHEALLVAWHCQLRQRCGPRPPRRPRLFRCPAQLRRLSCLRRRALPTFLWDLRFRPRQRRQAAVAAHPCHGQGCYRLKSFDPLVHCQSATPTLFILCCSRGALALRCEVCTAVGYGAPRASAMPCHSNCVRCQAALLPTPHQRPSQPVAPSAGLRMSTASAAGARAKEAARAAAAALQAR